MPGLGTIVNVIAILVGGFIGIFFGKFLKERHQDTMTKACGVSTLFIGIGGALEGILTIDSDGSLTAGKTMLIVVSMVLGGLVGEIINIDGLLERFAEWLKRKTGNAKDGNFVTGFVTASITVCVGAMAIMGSINDGIYHDYTLLFTKSILDFVILVSLTASLGKGCMFSALPVAVIQGLFTAFGVLIEPLMTEGALANLSTVGSLLIFCVGLNLVWGNKVRVANFLPALVFAVAFSFLPFF